MFGNYTKLNPFKSGIIIIITVADSVVAVIVVAVVVVTAGANGMHCIESNSKAAPRYTQGDAFNACHVVVLPQPELSSSKL